MKIRSAVLLAFAIAACGGDSGSPAAPNNTGGNNNGNNQTAQQNATVTLTLTSSYDPYGYGGQVSGQFTPESVTVTRGGTVTWVNTTSTAHNITFYGSTAGAPAGVTDFSSASRTSTFNTAGTYQFSCTNHPGMNGTVVVQ